MKSVGPRSRLLVGLTVLCSGQTAIGCGDAGQDPFQPSNGGFAGTGATGGAAPVGGASPAGGVPAGDPGRKDMHRLNTVEYNATVADVLGTALQPANANWRGGEFSGFDNIASVLGIDEAQYDRYFNAAQTLAAEVFASDELRARFVSCELSAPECVRASIEKAGLRLFRRPLAPDEVGTYQRVHEAALGLGDAPGAAFELAFQAMLSSAEFLYRIELDPEPQSAEAHPLSAFELSSRLSYFLWSSAPDEELLQAAEDGSLLDPATFAMSVDRMLGDPKSERFVSHFAGQWLGARQVLSHPVASKFDLWSPFTARAAADEILLYFSEFLRHDRSWFEFLSADVNFVDDGWLSALYGMPTPSVNPARVEFTSDRRAGFLGLAGFLAVTSFDRRTSPSLRGRWVASNLLCTDPPDPPPNVPKLEDDGQDTSALSVREVLERHRQNAECARCHSLFDPYGLALEEYDAIGQYRQAYANGTAVDASAVLPASDGHPEGLPFTGLEGLAQVVAKDPQFGRCVAEKLLTYGLGRPVASTDRPYLERVQREWLAPGQVPSLRRLIQALVSIEPFRLRRGEADPRVQP
jgi:hypothetical protein